jgi:hypothetical protein
MKRIIALVIVILGLAAMLVPTAGAKARGGSSGGSGNTICSCPVPPATK